MTLSNTALLKDPPAQSDAREISIAHSPDSDDAFMFYGLATNKVRVPGLRFSHTLSDIETLNRKAMQGGVYDVTAISFHAYPYLQDHYALLPSGGSVGEGYGPMIVSPQPFSESEIRQKRIAVPGKLTTAYLALQLFAPGIETVVVPFDHSELVDRFHTLGRCAVAILFASTILKMASCCFGWFLKYAPFSSPYHGQSYSVSAAECSPTKPPPERMYC